jgi:hypothetical protein
VDNSPYYFSPKKKPKAKAENSAPPAPTNVTNLETRGDALKVYSLQNLLRNKRTSKLVPTRNLCEVAKKLFEKEVAKPGKSLDGVIDLWIKNVPPELQDGCRLVGLARGTLTVAVRSSALRAELDGLLRSGLLRTLQSGSNGTIFRIKTSVQSSIPEIS